MAREVQSRRSARRRGGLPRQTCYPEEWPRLRESAHFDLDDLRTAAVVHGTIQNRRNPTCQRDVIVLDEDAIGEIEAVILAAAAAHSVFVDHAQSRGGFSGVENARFGAGDGLDKLAGQGCDSTHALQEIQNDALAGKNDAGIVLDHSNRLPFMEANAIEDLRMRGDFVVRRYGAIERGVDIENARHAADSRENAILLSENGGRGALVGIDAGVAGGITRGPVFEQRILDDGGDASAVKVHKAVVSRK